MSRETVSHIASRAFPDRSYNINEPQDSNLLPALVQKDIPHQKTEEKGGGRRQPEKLAAQYLHLLMGI